MLRAKRASLTVGRVRHLSSVSLSVFSLVPDLLFDYSRVLEYAKIRTVLQSSTDLKVGRFFYCILFNKYVNSFQENLVKRLYKADA